VPRSSARYHSLRLPYMSPLLLIVQMYTRTPENPPRCMSGHFWSFEYVPVRTFSSLSGSESGHFDRFGRARAEIQTGWPCEYDSGCSNMFFRGKPACWICILLYHFPVLLIFQDGRKERQALLDGRDVQYHSSYIPVRVLEPITSVPFLADPTVHTPSI